MGVLGGAEAAGGSCMGGGSGGGRLDPWRKLNPMMIGLMMLGFLIWEPFLWNFWGRALLTEIEDLLVISLSVSLCLE